MYALNIVRSLNKSFSTKVKSVMLLKIFQRNYKAKQPTSYDIRSQVKDDVVLFKLESPKYFLGINIFAAVQCTFWTYLGFVLFGVLENSRFKLEGNNIWAKVLQKEREYSRGLCTLVVFFGWAVLLGTMTYSMRSIRKIILHKDGKYITLVTYNLPNYNMLKVPLNNMSSVEHRTKAKKYIPIKLKDKFFYYLIDIRGEFLNPTLFDFTVGVKRSFR